MMKLKQIVAAVLLAVPAFMSQAMVLTSHDITNDKTLQNQQLFNQWAVLVRMYRHN